MKKEIPSKPLSPRRRFMLSFLSLILFLGIIMVMLWSAQESQPAVVTDGAEFFERSRM